MTGDGPTLDAGVGFALKVPPAWFEIDLRPGSRVDWARDRAAQLTREIRELRPYRAELARLLCGQAETAWGSGAVYCAAMAEPVVDGVLPAAVTVSFLPGPLGLRGDESDRVSALLPMLQEKRPRHAGDTWTRVDVLDLPDIGPAVRTRGVVDVEPEPGRRLRVADHQTFVPVPGVNRVVVVSFSSPAVAVAEGLHQLFDVIAGTLRLFPAGDVETVDAPRA